MSISILKLAEELIPKVFNSYVDPKSLEDYFIGDLCDFVSIDTTSSFSREEKAKIKKDKSANVRHPTLSELMQFKMITGRDNHNPQVVYRLMAFISAPNCPSVSEIMQLEVLISDLFGSYPITVVSGKSQSDIVTVRLIGTEGNLSENFGLRLAFDLESSLKFWPEKLAWIGQQNRQAKGFNMIISNRYEPSDSSRHKFVYQKEIGDIERLGIPMDQLIHSWLEFADLEKIFPFLGVSDWLNRYIWTEAFFCRLHRIDIFYQGQKRNLDFFKTIAPDVKILELSPFNQPEIPIELN